MNKADKRPWIAWLCAVPMPIIGVAVSLYLFVASLRAEFPDGIVCGNPGIVAVPLLFGGALGGIAAGAAVAELVTWFVRKRGRRNAGKDTTAGEEDLPAALCPGKTQWMEIRSEIDLVGSLIERAAAESDEDVLKKLTAYKARLENDVAASIR